VFPWFGPREGTVLHGFARLTDWELTETRATADGGAMLRFHLPESAASAAGWPPAHVDFIVTVSDKLTMELAVTNPSDRDFVFENLLHSYFWVGDIGDISITGLKGLYYLDKVENFARKLDAADAVRVTSETDRVYLDADGAVEIHDAGLHRKIRVEKSGSASTVVWNPWVAKSKALPDFGDDEFRQMVCVESGNVAQNKIILAPGRSSTLKIVLSTGPA